MDIKNALNAVIPLSLRAKDKVEKTIKSDSTTDRDGNGQMPSGQGEKQRQPMTDEEYKSALEHLRSLPVVKENNLIVELSLQEHKKFILLKEPSGKVVRRITEAELWSLLDVQPGQKGSVLNKSA
jgi:hypothetical protein